ncbi:hypothetical protein RhiirC2_852106 [Rhizophagus irregularis]|uniref:Uncharacterized protein n=1 Tax=Rhizophagus irregularis TaxID=588596 RepID=A0A2N1N0Q7_9GLOM|nr:hypothetical protein RhiirC2_852106 [Rhizophagus irregularis]
MKYSWNTGFDESGCYDCEYAGFDKAGQNRYRKTTKQTKHNFLKFSTNMKLQSFYLPIAIFICVCIAFVSVTDAYTASITRDMIAGTRCRLWVTDQNNNQIAGDYHYHECDQHTQLNITFTNTPNYWIHAEVQGSTRQKKDRGNFNGDICYHIHGDVFSWWFDPNCH